MALKVGELFASFSIDSSDLDSSLNQITQQCNNIGSGMMTAGVALSAAVTAPIFKAAKDMYTAGTDFEAQMSKVQAIAGLDTQIEADAAAIEALTQKALYMGSTTEWTATQSGEALEYMAMAGWKTDSMLAALPSVMNLATAAGADLGTTSDIVTDAMTAFGLTLQAAGGDTDVFTGYVEHFSDVLAAAATSSNTNVELLGTSFKYVAPLAGSLGMSVDDVAVALGLMANAGIKGTMSGAALRNIMTGLMGTTEKTAEACETLGVSLYDSRGNAKDLATVMQELRTASKKAGVDLKKMQSACEKLDSQLEAGTITQAEYDAQMDELTAGAGDFMKACVALAGKQGLSGLLAIMNASEEDFNALSQAIENCEGATAQMAKTMLDNAKGAVTVFKSAVEGLEITLWTLVADSFTNVVKGATEIIGKFQALDSSTQTAILKFAGLAAAAGPVLLVGGQIVKMLPTLVSGISALASPLGIVAAGLALFAVAAVDADNSIGTLFEGAAKNAKVKLQEINETIESKMNGVSQRMGALCKSIVNALNDLIPEAVTTASLLIEGFMRAISDNASSIAEIGKTVITGLLGGITENLPQLIPAAAEMVANIATALIDNIPALVDAVGKLMLAFVDGVKNTDWVSLGRKILTSIENAISGLTTIFDNWFIEASKHVAGLNWADIGVQMIDLILSATVKTATTIGTFLSNLITSIGNYTGWSSLGTQLGVVAEKLIVGIAEAIPKLSGVVSNIIEAIGTALSSEGTASLIAGFENLASAIISGISDAIPKVASGASQIVTAIANMLNGLEWGSLTDSATQIGKALVDMIVVGIKGASDAAVTIVEAIGSLFGAEGLATKLVSAAGSIASSLITAITDAIPDVSNAAVSIVNSIGSLLSGENTDAFTAAVGGIAKTLISNIADAIPKVASGAVNLINAIGNLLTGEAAVNLVSSFGTIATSIIEGLVDAIPKVANAAVNIIGALGTILSGEKTDGLISAMTSVATSIINGIIEAIPKVASAAVNIIDAIGSLFTANGAASAIAEGALGIATSLMTAITKAIPTVVNAASDIVGSIGKLLMGEKNDSFVKNVEGIATSLINSIVEAIPKVSQGAVKLISSIGDLLTGEAPANLISSFGSIATSIIKGIVDSIPKVANAAVNIIDAIGKILSGEHTTEIVSSLTNVATSIVNGIIEGIPKVANAAVSIIDAIGSLFTAEGAGTNIANGALSIATSIVNAVIEGIPKITTAATNIIAAIGQLFTEGGGGANFRDQAISIATSLIESIASAIPTLATSASEIVAAIGSALAGYDWAGYVGDLSSLGEAIINAIVQGIKGLGQVGVAIVDAVGGLLGSINWEDVTISMSGFADMLVQGIIKGLDAVKSVSTDLVSAISGMLDKIDWNSAADSSITIAQKIIDGIVKGLGKMSEISVDLANGLAGIIKKIPWSTLGDATGALATSIIDGIVNGLKTITPDMSELITAIGRGIESALEGLATAAGTIVGKLAAYIIENAPQLVAVGAQLVGEVVKGILGIGVSLIESSANVLTNVIVGFFRGVFGIEVDPYVEQMLNNFSEAMFDVSPQFNELGQACGYALMVAMESAMSNGAELERAVEAWGIVVENGYAELMPQFEWLGNESVVSLARGVLSSIESSTPDIQNTAEEAAILISTGYAEHLMKGLYANQPAVYDALYDLIMGGELDLTALAQEHGYNMGDLMGSALPEGYSVALINGSFAIKDATNQVIWMAEDTIEAGWNMDEVMSALWDAAFATTLVDIQSWQPQLQSILQTMGVNAGSLLGIALPAGVAEGLRSGTMSVQQAAAEIAAAAAASEAQVAAAKEKNKTGGKTAGDGLKEGVDEAEPGVETASEALGTAVETGLEGMPEVVASIGDEGMNGLQTAILEGQSPVETAAATVSDAAVQKFLATMSADNGSTIGTEFVGGILSALTEGESSIPASAETIATTTLETVNSVLTSDAGSTIGTDFTDGLNSSLESGGAAILSEAESIASGVKTAFENDVNNANGATIGTNFTSGLMSAISQAASPIVSAATMIGTMVRTMMSSLLASDQGNYIGSNFMNGLMSGMYSASSGIVNAAVNIANNARTSAMNILTSGAGSSIGSSFSYGIASGISAGRSAVVNAAASVAAAAVAAAKSTLSINSPSRVARDEVGMMYDAGLVEGLRKGMAAVQNAAVQVSDTLHDSFYVGDTSRGTVYTSQQQAAVNARKAAEAERNGSMLERAEALGRAIADRLIESGALNSDVYMDEEKVGRKVAQPVSSTISKKTKETIAGRSLQGVIA